MEVDIVTPPRRETPARNRLLLSTEELAEVLGVGYTTAREMIDTVPFPTVQVGRFTKVPIADVEAWIARTKDLRGEPDKVRTMDARRRG